MVCHRQYLELCRIGRICKICRICKIGRVIEEKAKAFGCLFIHYCQFLALQLSSGENTIGKFGNGKLQLVHVVSVLKGNIAQKKAIGICTQSGSSTAEGSRTRQARCRQLENTSHLLLRVAHSGLKRMCHFSSKQRRHCLLEMLYPPPLAWIDQAMV